MEFEKFEEVYQVLEAQKEKQWNKKRLLLVSKKK